MATLPVPTIDDDGYRPDLDAFDCEAALEAALEMALCLELDCTNCCQVAAAWNRVHALIALCDRA